MIAQRQAIIEQGNPTGHEYWIEQLEAVHIQIEERHRRVCAEYPGEPLVWARETRPDLDAKRRAVEHDLDRAFFAADDRRLREALDGYHSAILRIVDAYRQAKYMAAKGYRGRS